MTARELLQHTYDVLSSILLDHAGEDLWEEAFPEIDELRTEIGEALAQPEKVES